ncbi:MAG: cation-translocating P-type ATPase [Lacipirellulaceae bacterium]
MNAATRQSYCAFCGLPVPKSFSFGKQAGQDSIGYCCSGCRTVATVQEAEQEEGAAARHLMKLGLAIFFTMNVMVFTMALWSRDVYPEEAFSDRFAETLHDLFRWGSMVFSLPVLWLLGGPIVSGVWDSLRRRVITSDLLIVLGVLAAYLYSAISVLRGGGHIYFEVGTMVLVFVSLGRWLEAKGKRRTGESLDALASLLPDNVRVQQPDGQFREARRVQAATGDIIRVLAGERFPVDGQIVAGCASVDEQIVTGESRHVTKSLGDTVASGTLNIDGDLRIEVTAADGQETISRLIQLVREARSQKGRYEKQADRIAAWFVPLVLLIAVIAGWLQGVSGGVDQGILTSLAVVLIACPCALGLATPMAVWTALGRAAECGVLFRSGMMLEKLANVQHARFDKTGTLTSGDSVARSVIMDEGQNREQLLTTAAALAEGSSHPVSRGVLEFIQSEPLERHGSPEVSVTTLPGKGLKAETSLGTVFLGSALLMEERDLKIPPRLQEKLANQPKAKKVYLGWEGHIRGAFCFQEELRPEAPTAIAMCRNLELDLAILTGDTLNHAESVAYELDIPVQGKQLPEDKADALRSLATGEGVAMVGDGMNDAPALATADVGVALGCGADVARDAAGVCLLADDLRRFPWAVSLARATVSVVRQNLFWAFFYNSIGIAFAATGHLNPIFAALAMAVSSLLVVVNSLRLSRFPDLSENRIVSQQEDLPVRKSLPIADAVSPAVLSHKTLAARAR